MRDKSGQWISGTVEQWSSKSVEQTLISLLAYCIPEFPQADHEVDRVGETIYNPLQ